MDSNLLAQENLETLKPSSPKKARVGAFVPNVGKGMYGKGVL